MPCTTLLVGKKASNDGSSMIARTNDTHFGVKKMIVVEPKKQPRKYTSVIGHLTIELPEEPLRYTACPNVDLKNGLWAVGGFNAAGVSMTATETITTNPRVLAADPMVEYKKAEKRGQKDVPGGIGEEDLVVLVLPYIHSAREGVLRLGKLLEEYGTYESNGIAFNDRDEVWWFETIGGHHWIAARVRDEEVVVMPNQFGLDRFDFADAYGKQKDYLCSADLKEFVATNHLDLNQGKEFNPRLAFGSHSLHDHVYNTPRAWYMGRSLCPTRYKWDGPDADFTPVSDDIPWSFIPERKLAAEDVAQILSSHYEDTPYDPFAKFAEKPGILRPIGISRTDVTTINQIRPDMPEELAAVEWLCFASTTYSAFLPLYPHVSKMPKYLSEVTMDCSTENLFWASRLIGALTDPHYGHAIMEVGRYKEAVAVRGRQIIREYDQKMIDSGDYSLTAEANEKLCDMAKKQTIDTLNKVLLESSKHMKNGFNLADN